VSANTVDLCGQHGLGRVDQIVDGRLRLHRVVMDRVDGQVLVVDDRILVGQQLLDIKSVMDFSVNSHEISSRLPRR
jgi:hypothetical protein